MHTQPDMFLPFLAEDFSHQSDLFPAEDLSSSLRCDCGEYLLRTASGHLACPSCRGRLLVEEQQPAPFCDEDDEDDADLFEAAAVACRERGQLDAAAMFERWARRARL